MKLTLYSYWRSSAAWRVRNGLAIKGLAYDYVAVDLSALEQYSDAHRARSPLSMVPVLAVEDGGKTYNLVQSIPILEWLDERFPDPPLLPPDLYGRARVRALAEHVNSSIQPHQNAAVLRLLRERGPPAADTRWAAFWIRGGLEGLERAVNDGGAGRFCHGDLPGLADCHLVPQMYNARRFGVDVTPYPTLRRIEEACLALAPFQAALPDRQPDTPPSERRKP
jgi:maleylpyruvate isomerase